MVVCKLHKTKTYFLGGHFTVFKEQYLSAKSYMKDFLDRFEAAAKKSETIAPTVVKNQKTFPRL